MERELSAEIWADWGWSLWWNSRGAVWLQVPCRGKGFSWMLFDSLSSQTLFSHYLRAAQILKTHPTGCWVLHSRNALGNVASPELDWKSDFSCNDCPVGALGWEQPWNWDPHGDCSCGWAGRWKEPKQGCPGCGSQSRWGWRALCWLLPLLPNWQLFWCWDFISRSLWNFRRILFQKKWVWSWTHHLLLLPDRACSKQQTIHLKGFWLTASCELLWGFNSSFFSLWGAESWWKTCRITGIETPARGAEMSTLMEESKKLWYQLQNLNTDHWDSWLRCSGDFCHLLCRQWGYRAEEPSWLVTAVTPHRPSFLQGQMGRVDCVFLKGWKLTLTELRTEESWGPLCTVQALVQSTMSHVLSAFPEGFLQLSVGCRYSCGTWKAPEIRYGVLFVGCFDFLLTWER